jgi:hypothetical protein
MSTRSPLPARPPRLRRPLIRQLIAFACVVLVAAPASFPQGAVDTLRVRQLEQDIMRLQRELDAQSRRLDTLERTQRNASSGMPAPTPRVRDEDNSPAWLVGTNWDRIRPGMKELEVIALLGRPTTVRVEDDGKGRAFFYAMELGPNAILSGNVRLGDAGVTEINRPALR